ncbi:MAG: amino acid deaminase [Geminicoccaceae bacterium]|nr:amino acid deaminase [Geminicoccaceae bacterium]
MRLDALLDEDVPVTTKGWPVHARDVPLRKVAAERWSLLDHDLPMPAAVLKESALSHNSRWMRSFLERFDVKISPHGKTTMAPQLFARQLADGAEGITVATVQQMMVCRRFGVPKVLIANQVVGRQAIRTLLGELKDDPSFEVTCLVDSVAGIEAIAKEADEIRPGRPLRVLLEGGVEGARTGCRTVEQGLEVARAAAASPAVALVGVEGFEGVISRGRPEEGEAAVGNFLHFLVELAQGCAREGLFAPGPVLLTAGGSSFFDLVTRIFGEADLGRETRTVLRSGCYLTHDSKMYTQAFARLRERMPEVDALGPGLRPALEVWAVVQSVPEPGRVILTMGKRDVSFDSGLPVAERWFRSNLHRAPQTIGEGFEVVALNDQHAFLDVPESSPLQVGDLVGFGISHPCTTFDRWGLLYVVDDDYRVTGAVKTFF